ncbi:MAG TPA: multicopper oxidase domain-containing protein, partial [Anaeromyxobacteraceae bacterium]|nr:multicopper oxidase domain-containing protein [Anaeromyxobacteraceae bacterium]
PTWVPEYFGDHSVVNGALWPKATVEPGWYRLRFVDGSDSRCYTWGLNVAPANAPTPAPGTKVANNLAFFVIANDQGYLRAPVKATSVTMCPGERYEILVNFGQVGNKIPVGGAARVFMTNSAAAPFPAGLTPQAAASPYADLNVLMAFDINPLKGPGVKSCAAGAVNSWDPTYTQAQMTAAIAARTACMPATPAQIDPGFVDIRPALWPIAPPAAGAAPAPILFNDGKSLVPIVRQIYMNEKVDGTTLVPLGMQLNGVPFEYKVTETPRQGSREIWQFVNLTVDAHPMHPHLVKHQIVARQTFNVGQYKARLCGSTTCQPGTAPGGEMQVVPDVTPLLTATPVLVNNLSVEGGYKDATQVPPGRVTTIVADWTARWPVAAAGANATAPGTAGCVNGTLGCAAPYVYEPVTSGPYVWHCHINSHEDSEMMRTSLVVP